MSTSIQGWQPWTPYVKEPDNMDELLRSEIGWQEVASGLGKVLFGYLLMVLSAFSLIGLLLYLVMNAVANQRPNAQSLIVAMWVFWLGIGVIGLLTLYSYIQIFAGKCRCAIHSPERCGAKWFIFACLLCIAVGPVLGTVNSVAVNVNIDSDAKKKQLREELLQQLRRGDEAQGAILSEIRRSFSITQMAAILVSMGTSIFFVLFLRSVGSCFEERRLTIMADLYLMYSALLIGFSVFLVMFAGLNQSMFLIMVATGVGGLLSIGWYIGLIIYARCLILNKLNRIRSPLES